METKLYLYEEEIRIAIKYWIENTKGKKVRMDTITEQPSVFFRHSEDDRASGCFNYHADVDIEND